MTGHFRISKNILMCSCQPFMYLAPDSMANPRLPRLNLEYVVARMFAVCFLPLSSQMALHPYVSRHWLNVLKQIHHYPYTILILILHRTTKA